MIATATSDVRLCSRCHEYPRRGRCPFCVHCLTVSASKARATKRRQGQRPFRTELLPTATATHMACMRCGQVVGRAHASLHAWQAHRVAVPVRDLRLAFKAVTR